MRDRSFQDAFLNDPNLKVNYIEIGEICLGYNNDLLIISALGSCVGLTIYPKNQVELDRCAIMGHIMLPFSSKRDSHKLKKARFSPAKYADRAVPTMVEKLENLGFNRKHLEAKMVGGAKMFGFLSDSLDVGKNNIDATKVQLRSFGIPLVGQYTGGATGMKVVFHVRDYKLIVTPTKGSPMFI
ncbi:MAG: chemotaxis protein CheD [Candidatus Thorarchaeota archaeon]